MTIASNTVRFISMIEDLTAFQRDLLFVIAACPGDKGLALKDELEREYMNVRHGRLYPNLDDLVEMGLITKSNADKRTNAYQITRRGERELLYLLRWQLTYLDESDVDVPDPVEGEWERGDFSNVAAVTAPQED